MLLKSEKPVNPVEPLLELDDAALVAQAVVELPYVTCAYERLIKRYYPLIYRTCLGVLRSPEEAEEISQVVLLKVFNGLPKFEGRSTFKTWLITIVKNACFSRHQKLKLERERFFELTDEKGDECNDQNDTSPESLWQDSFGSMVKSLSEEEQQILTLRFVSELSLAEIAVVMKIGLSATKMRFYRALEKLKEQV